METGSQGQVTASAAEVYDRFFLPALMAQWTPHVLERARLKAGDHVLDVGCGTGVIALAAHDLVAPTGEVTAVDINDGMLAVGRKKSDDVHWQQAPAERLPFPDASFDAALCQFGLMFFQDRAVALREMRRVLVPGGRIVVAVWAGIRTSPGYAALSALVGRLFGPVAQAEIDAPFVLGDKTRLRASFTAAGIDDVLIDTVEGLARFPSLDDWMTVEIKGWTLADRIDDAGFTRLRQAADEELKRFERPDGTIEFPLAAHIVTARG